MWLSIVVDNRTPKFLLWKYKTPDIHEASGVKKQHRKEYKTNLHVRLVHPIAQSLKLNTIQMRRAESFVRSIPDLKSLHRQCTVEAIITAICFYIKVLDDSKVKISYMERYKVCKENKLTVGQYAIIATRISGYTWKKGVL